MHATAAALSPGLYAYAVAPAIVYVYLIAYKLVAPQEHYGNNRPASKTVVVEP